MDSIERYERLRDEKSNIYIDTDSALQLSVFQDEIFCVTNEGRIIRNDKDITDDDAALAVCLMLLLKSMYNLDINHG